MSQFYFNEQLLENLNYQKSKGQRILVRNQIINRIIESQSIKQIKKFLKTMERDPIITRSRSRTKQQNSQEGSVTKRQKDTKRGAPKKQNKNIQTNIQNQKSNKLVQNIISIYYLFMRKCKCQQLYPTSKRHKKQQYQKKQNQPQWSLQKQYLKLLKSQTKKRIEQALKKYIGSKNNQYYLKQLLKICCHLRSQISFQITQQITQIFLTLLQIQQKDSLSQFAQQIFINTFQKQSQEIIQKYYYPVFTLKNMLSKSKLEKLDSVKADFNRTILTMWEFVQKFLRKQLLNLNI